MTFVDEMSMGDQMVIALIMTEEAQDLLQAVKAQDKEAAIREARQIAAMAQCFLAEMQEGEVSDGRQR